MREKVTLESDDRVETVKPTTSIESRMGNMESEVSQLGKGDGKSGKCHDRRASEAESTKSTSTGK